MCEHLLTVERENCLLTGGNLEQIQIKCGWPPASVGRVHTGFLGRLPLAPLIRTVAGILPSVSAITDVMAWERNACLFVVHSRGSRFLDMNSRFKICCWTLTAVSAASQMAYSALEGVVCLKRTVANDLILMQPHFIGLKVAYNVFDRLCSSNFALSCSLCAVITAVGQ